MPRIAEVRPPAEPSSPEQRARHLRILRAAAHIGAENGLERVQMHEVAKAAGVAIGTLYRYFPSKTHLFTAVMAEQIDRFGENLPKPAPGTSPEDAVGDVLVSASRQLLRKPALATAMLQSANAANAAAVADAARIDGTFGGIILRVLGIDDPTVQDVTLVRLLLQCWYGVLQFSLNGRASIADTESDIRLACRLLLAPRSNAPQD
ncbi:TetR/AcrR family transcriptional regulator [Planomonospora sp. ID91781]|uniref:TetR family transcriptional regulator n=1 Tax=Planomonospora sphaerica TaxID=161355 RepID=A0A171DLZ7_9ACTN|nr:MULTISPECIES: TetR family transcriptional regulator [Planomonospora]MBG0822590.1 TetR/AcrR family transcriptional regulator [Planomonospora sp. ID91781]GAT69941.1 tetR family transcriptional regulator [Planomonospora sphaerica]